jgi:pyruvate,water dikinase
MAKKMTYIRWFSDLRSKDVPVVGGKNSSLGEMVCTLKKEGIHVPDGFASTSKAYWMFLDDNKIRDKIHALVEDLHKGRKSLSVVGKSIRNLFLKSEFPEEIADEIKVAYQELSNPHPPFCPICQGRPQGSVLFFPYLIFNFSATFFSLETLW